MLPGTCGKGATFRCMPRRAFIRKAGVLGGARWCRASGRSKWGATADHRRAPPTPRGMRWPHRAVREVGVGRAAARDLPGQERTPYSARPPNLRRLTLDHGSFAASCPLAPVGTAFHPGLGHRPADCAPRFLSTVGHPSAVALHFPRCGLLGGGLASPGVRPCRAHKKNPGTGPGFQSTPGEGDLLLTGRRRCRASPRSSH